MSNPENITVSCPRCHKKALWHGNDFRPFCSERCKMIDLGAWASDEYKIPTLERPSEITPEHDQD